MRPFQHRAFLKTGYIYEGAMKINQDFFMGGLASCAGKRLVEKCGPELKTLKC